MSKIDETLKESSRYSGQRSVEDRKLFDFLKYATFQKIQNDIGLAEKLDSGLKSKLESFKNQSLLSG